MKINTDLNHLGFTKKTGTKNIFELIYTKSWYQEYFLLLSVPC
jgi:hypothetical protein